MVGAESVGEQTVTPMERALGTLDEARAALASGVTSAEEFIAGVALAKALLAARAFRDEHALPTHTLVPPNVTETDEGIHLDILHAAERNDRDAERDPTVFVLGAFAAMVTMQAAARQTS